MLTTQDIVDALRRIALVADADKIFVTFPDTEGEATPLDKGQHDIIDVLQYVADLLEE